MFEFIHALKQIKPLVLSLALIETVRKTASSTVTAEATLHRPLPAKALSPSQSALGIFHQALTKSPGLSLPESKSVVLTHLQTLLQAWSEQEILQMEELPLTEIVLDFAAFNKQIEIMQAPTPLALILEDFFSKSTDLLAVKTFPDFSLTALNPPLQQFLGLDNEEKLPIGWLGWIHPEDRLKTFEALELLLDGKQSTVEYENRLRKTSGSLEPVYERIRWRLAKQDNYVYATGIDLSAQLKNSVAHQKSQEQESTAILFHELRNPLNGILGNAHLMRAHVESLTRSIDKYREASDMQLNLSVLAQSLEYLNKKLRTIEYCSKDQLLILNHVLDFNKLAQTGVELEIKPFALLRDVVSPLIEMYSVSSEEKSIIFKICVPSTDLGLKGDSHRIKQILMNLLSNAVKFAAPVSGEPATVELSLSMQRAEDAQQLHFKVKNSGKGLTPPQIYQLFKPYTQSDPTITRRFGGTGLGLVVCKQLLELMHGNVVCTSSLSEQWVQFDMTLALPIAQKAKRIKGKRKERKVQRPQLKIRPPLNARVLLAEDNDINQKLMVEILKKFNCVVDVAVDGQQAVSLYSDSPRLYNLILMDVQMPKMDGLEATRAIRSLEKADLRSSQSPIPIIGLSADGFLAQQQQAREAGMNDYLIKPVQQSDLYDKLAQYSHTNRDTDSPNLTPSSSQEQKSGQSSPALFTRRHLTPVREHSTSFILLSGRTDSKRDEMSPPANDREKFQIRHENSEIDSLKVRVDDLERVLQQPASPLPGPPQAPRLQEVKNSAPRPSRAFPLTRFQPGSVSAPLLSHLPPIPAHTHNLSLFNPLTSQNIETKATAIQKARLMLQNIDYYFREACADQNIALKTQGDLQFWIDRLTRCYQTTTIKQRALIAATAVGYWQALLNQGQKTPQHSLAPSLLKIAESNLDAWNLQMTFLEQFEQSSEARPSSCCIIA